MPHGGVRIGAGRPMGSKNTKVSIVKQILDENKEVIINKAIALATQKEPNTAILLKLLDKIAPTLSSANDKLTTGSQSVLDDFEPDELKSMAMNLTQLINKRETQLKENDKTPKAEKQKQKK